MGMAIGNHGEWQTRNDSLTIRERDSPNGKGNDNHCSKTVHNTGGWKNWRIEKTG